MKNVLMILGVIIVLIIAGIVIYKSTPHADTVFPEPVEEIMEATSTPEVVIDPETTTERPGTNEVNDTNKTITARLHEKITFNNLTVDPWAVMEDSRCPKDVQCIQAGRVVVAINVHSSSGTLIRTAELEEGKSIQIGSTRITLVRVMPDTVSTRKISDDEYRFTFSFETIE